MERRPRINGQTSRASGGTMAGQAGHASRRGISGNNASRGADLAERSKARSTGPRIVALKVRSDASLDAAMRHVPDDAGGLDVIVHDAGHMPSDRVRAEEYAAGLEPVRCGRSAELPPRQTARISWRKPATSPERSSACLDSPQAEPRT